MLTADLVRARRRKGKLTVTHLQGEAKDRAEAIAARFLAIAEAHVGHTRRELVEAIAAVPVPARDRKVADGLRKLVLDRCELEADAPIDPTELRADVFGRASARRRAAADDAPLDRDALLAEVAAEREVSVEELERLLFADLREHHRVLSFEPIGAGALVEAYDLANEQAVLLRAERVEVRVRCESPAAYRQFFRKLKFFRLLHTIERADDGYRVVVDGPFSLFGPVTKYGLSLALLLPALRELDRYELTATVRWGKKRDRLEVELSGGCGDTVAERETPGVPEEVEVLLSRFAKRKTPWRAEPSTEILSLPGVGEVVPDLVFVHEEHGARVHLEVLGFWSREAVWRRVELVEKGLSSPLVFAVPKRLRVSEEVLGDDLPAAIYVYKGVLSAKAIEERLDAVSARG